MASGTESTSEAHATPPVSSGESSPPLSHSPRRSTVLRIAIIVLLIGGMISLTPWVRRLLSTVSTDDAYVNGHVTFVAPRVPGQVVRVLVDDNNRVKKGDLLVQLDKEPYRIAVSIAEATLGTAEANLTAAIAQARGVEGQMRSLRFGLERAIEDVNNQIELLKSKVATLDAQKAVLARTKSDYQRALETGDSGGLSKEEVDHRKQAVLVSQAQVEEAIQGVYQVRVSLGLQPKPAPGEELTSVPPNLEQTFSSVREAQAKLIQAAAQIGITDSFEKTPRQMVADFQKRDPTGDIDRIYEELLKGAPGVKQAQAKVLEARTSLDQAKLNLSYCDVVAEIDGAITRRNVNPGNNVIAGQSLMAIRSLTQIWVDANFKETQLADLRIGQEVDLDVDMYGSSRAFKGRISGFTMGTGSTLALLPAENATGNFVKVVQRLPVRIELIDYDPENSPLFIGLSVTPRVNLKAPPTGPNAGKFLQPILNDPVPAPTPEPAK